jgi:uncharacterized membrane protein
LVSKNVLNGRNDFLFEQKESTVSTKPNQGKNSDQDRYSGYGGYQPRKPADDPYGAYDQPSGSQLEGTTGTAGEQQSDPNYVYGQQQQYRSSSASSSQQQQQGSTYRPPGSVTGRRSGSSSQQSTRLKPNHAAALSYLGICFTGLFFFFWERKNRLVRFSAAQSIVLFFPLLVIYSILRVIIGFISAVIPFIGPFVAGFLGTAVFFIIVLPGIVVWLILMIQAYRGVEVKLPYVGEYAERLLRLFSPRQKKAGN